MIMKDAFNKTIKVGSVVLYSTGGGGRTIYNRGKVVRLVPAKDLDEDKSYTPPDRVEVEITKTTALALHSKKPLIYASNVVVL
jgi:hypothetical protein